MTDIIIDSININDYPVGTKLICFYGAMYPWVECEVVAHQVQPASEHFPEKHVLVVSDELNEMLVYCGRLVKSGIGVYLKKDFMRA